MKYWIDEEFIDDGSTIDLISIGIIAEDGREYYAQANWFTWVNASNWVKEHVYPHLSYCSSTGEHKGGVGTIHLSKVYHQGIVENVLDYGADPTGDNDSTSAFIKAVNAASEKYTPTGQCYLPDCPWRSRGQMMYDLMNFLSPEKYGKPELYGWCSGYDFVTLCQLFGTMMDIPTGWPHYIKDLQYILDEKGISDDELPQQEEGLHNALSDARHLKKLWEFVQGVYTDELTGIRMTIERNSLEHPRITVICPKHNTLSFEQVSEAISRLRQRAGISPEIFPDLVLSKDSNGVAPMSERLTIEQFLKALIAFLELPKEQEWENERFELLEYARELLPADNQPHHACTSCGSIFVVDGGQCRSCADGL